MKKSIITLFIFVSIGFVSKAQVDPHAIGVRLGGGWGFGAEFSYQHGFSRANRLELDLGFGGNSQYGRMGVTGVYQWVWAIGGDGLNWFIGPGAAISLNNGKDYHDDYVGVAIGGQIGIGFNFSIPLQLTLDFRPMWDFVADTDNWGWGFGLGIRYRF